MTSLPSGTQPMRDGRHAHAHIGDSIKGQQRVCGTGCNAWKIFTEDARRFISKDSRRAIPCDDDGSGRTGSDAVPTLGATLRKDILIDGTWRPKPIRAGRWRRLHRDRVFVLRKLLRRFGDGQDRILEKVTPAIGRVHRHRATLTSPRPLVVYTLPRNDHRPQTQYPTRGDFLG
jgi:hypothetical protein